MIHRFDIASRLHGKKNFKKIEAHIKSIFKSPDKMNNYVTRDEFSIVVMIFLVLSSIIPDCFKILPSLRLFLIPLIAARPFCPHRK